MRQRQNILCPGCIIITIIIIIIVVTILITIIIIIIVVVITIIIMSPCATHSQTVGGVADEATLEPLVSLPYHHHHHHHHNHHHHEPLTARR